MKKMMIALLACFSLNLSASTHELFLVKKNFNPENILHFDANLTDDCKFKLDNPLHIYWILGNSPTKHAPGFPESSFLVTEYIEKTEGTVGPVGNPFFFLPKNYESLDSRVRIRSVKFSPPIYSQGSPFCL